MLSSPRFDPELYTAAMPHSQRLKYTWADPTRLRHKQLMLGVRICVVLTYIIWQKLKGLLYLWKFVVCWEYVSPVLLWIACGKIECSHHNYHNVTETNDLRQSSFFPLGWINLNLIYKWMHIMSFCQSPSVWAVWVHVLLGGCSSSLRHIYSVNLWASPPANAFASLLLMYRHISPPQRTL